MREEITMTMAEPKKERRNKNRIDKCETRIRHERRHGINRNGTTHRLFLEKIERDIDRFENRYQLTKDR